MSFYIYFDPDTNYIGNKPWHYKLTNWIAKRFPAINFTSLKHDAHIALTLAEKNTAVRFFLTILYDIIYLLSGIFRLLIHPKQWLGIPIMFVLYIALTIYIFNRQWENRKRFLDLSLNKK